LQLRHGGEQRASPYTHAGYVLLQVAQSGIGRENHKMMLDHYQQTKNMLVSYSTKALGFF
jgi:acyl-CoA reductase-like NAD-dependent aldehyde dehydrogenase